MRRVYIVRYVYIEWRTT